MATPKIELALDLDNEQAAKAIEEISGALENIQDVLEETKNMIGQVEDALSRLAGGFQSASKAQADTAKSFITFQTSINVLQTLVAGFTGLLFKNSKSIKDFFGNALLEIGVFAEKIAVPLNLSIGGLAGLVGGAVAVTGAAIGLAVYNDDLRKSMENLEAVTEVLGEKFVNVAQYAVDFYDGISGAKSILDGFNTSISESAGKQSELAKEVSNTQTEIADSIHALAETEGEYNQKQVANIDSMFEKLHEKSDAELASHTALQDIVKQRAEDSIALGTLTEEQAQRLIQSAKETKEAVLNTAEEQYNNELALLYERFAKTNELDSEEYEKSRIKALERYNAAIEDAQKREGDTLSVIQEGYFGQSEALKAFQGEYVTYTQEIDAADQEHSARIKENMDAQSEILNQGFQNQYSITSEIGGGIRTATAENTQARADALHKLSGSMDEETQEQLGSWMAMLGDTELKTGKINGETDAFVNGMIDLFEKMPQETKDAMKNVMQPMLNTMQEKEPSLFEKATGIATGILTRLKKAFNIQSPSKEVKKIFLNVMKGAEQGLEEEKPDLLDQAANIADSVLDKLDMEQKKIPALKLTAELDEAHLHEQAKDAVAALVAKMAAAVWLQSGSLFAHIGAAANYQAGGQPAGVTNNVGGDTYILNQPVATPGELFRAAKIRRKEAAYE